jgi:hypothetical protein
MACELADTGNSPALTNREMDATKSVLKMPGRRNSNLSGVAGFTLIELLVVIVHEMVMNASKSPV